MAQPARLLWVFVVVLAGTRPALAQDVPAAQPASRPGDADTIRAQGLKCVTQR